ncbi:MAG: L-threonate dehydrogenase [Candidatus Latescibacterota bacterium]
MKAAVIGLGSMGSGIAKSLLRAGVETVGYDTDETARQALVASGGTAINELDALPADCDIALVVVVNAEQVEQALMGPRGAAAHLPAGAVVAVCSTVSPAFARTMAARVEDLGLHYLDAPISGGSARAADGSLTVMASGSPAAFERAQTALDGIASTVHRLSEAAGDGSAYKMINQLLAGVHIVAAAEAMSFGLKNGLDPHTLYEVITGSAGNSWMFENRGQHILDGDYTPHSAIDIFVKDLGIVLDTSSQLRFPLPLAAAASQLFTMAASKGWGALDDAAVAKVYEALSDIDLPNGPAR